MYDEDGRWRKIEKFQRCHEICDEFCCRQKAPQVPILNGFSSSCCFMREKEREREGGKKCGGEYDVYKKKIVGEINWGRSQSGFSDQRKS